ncbi:unnamed protein product [Miscanthus lutarioriparius]|uniref:DUF4220 domain-containing protein n=1 Tax=Miscanthus lutarioriparius TaxID=422564 RepID=A0A811NG79_9POAL|nr:unnamed protein product [Miscanthus lutarioriparius]
MANIRRCLYECVLFKARVHICLIWSTLRLRGREERRSVRRSIQGMANHTVLVYVCPVQSQSAPAICLIWKTLRLRGREEGRSVRRSIQGMANRTLAADCIALKAKDHHDLRDVNTLLSGCAKYLWGTARATVIRIEVLVVLSAISLLFMATFGPLRRRIRNSFVQNGVMVAYALSSSLISYTLGSMYSSAVKSSMYPIWASSLYLLFGSADSITAYCLNDNNQQKNQLFLFLLFQIYVTLINISHASLVIWVSMLASFKFMQRFWAYQLAAGSWNLNKMVADYMYEEHSRSGPSYDPTSMKGYHYLVDWPLDESKLEARMSYAMELTVDGAQIIDIERIWLCNELSSELKDVCLSFSLFHLLRRRFFGIFRVIEVELTFMYDFFFTKYAVLYYGSKKASTIWSLASASLMSVTIYQLTASVLSNHNGSEFKDTTTFDVIVTILILVCIALLEFIQVLFFWSTIWGRVSFVCHYVREQAMSSRRGVCTKLLQKICCMRFREIILTMIIGISRSRSRSSEYYYQNKLGQYSLLESVISYNYKQSPCKVGLLRFMNRHCSLISSPSFGHLCETNKDIIHARRIRRGHVKPAAIKLPVEVKKALVHSLLRTQGVLANGESSLVYNEVHDLLWACRHNMLSDSGINSYLDKENQTHIILTWHIATCYCEVQTLKCLSPRVGGALKLHLDVATILSKYCAYLVVSAPKLLPGHHYDSSLVFDAVAVEAAQFLQKVEDKYEALRSLPESTETSIFRRGMKLGRQLEEMEDDKCWKVLADFWAEMLLYVAPSENVKEHIETLTNGGEFITHWWALLTHAGILKRPPRNVNNDIENPWEGSSYGCPSTTQAAPAACATNQQPVTGNHSVQLIERNVGDIENARTDRHYPGEISYGAALRLRRANSYISKCREGATLATSATNKQATHGKCEQAVGIMIRQQAYPVQNVELPIPNASTAPSENKEIE